MTFSERVRALEHLGFSERQTRFIVTVALHSGFCLRRHYATLTGLRYGAGVRGFLDRLVARGLARRHAFRRDRGHVYHLHHASIYASIGQDDNRNRRHTSPALIARKLMMLDYVLDHPDTEWIATEQDKVALFTTRFGVPLPELPHRVYVGRRQRQGRSTTTRYFVHKLPIGLQPGTPIVRFVVLVTDTGGQLLSQFLQDHVRLLSILPRWRIVAVLPGHVPGSPAACSTAPAQQLCGGGRHHRTSCTSRSGPATWWTKASYGSSPCPTFTGFARSATGSTQVSSTGSLPSGGRLAGLHPRTAMRTSQTESARRSQLGPASSKSTGCPFDTTGSARAPV